MAALVDRQATFMAEPEWKTIPFQGNVAPRTMTDWLTDILAAVPGVLGAIEELKQGSLGRFALVQRALQLAYSVRCINLELEKWKVDHLLAHPALAGIAGSNRLGISALSAICIDQSPYDPILAEAFNCYCTTHLILARIAWGLSQRSLLIGFAVQPPYSIRDLLSTIVAVSRKHVAAMVTGMISMIVTTFALKAVETLQ